jgi:hypothetical protein
MFPTEAVLAVLIFPTEITSMFHTQCCIYQNSLRPQHASFSSSHYTCHHLYSQHILTPPPLSLSLALHHPFPQTLFMWSILVFYQKQPPRHYRARPPPPPQLSSPHATTPRYSGALQKGVLAKLNTREQQDAEFMMSHKIGGRVVTTVESPTAVKCASRM